MKLIDWLFWETLQSIKQELHTMATTIADIKAKSAEILQKTTDNTNQWSAITGYIDDLKAQIVTAKAELDAARADDDPAGIQAASDNLDAILAGINAQAAAQAAVLNTPAATDPVVE